MPSGGNLVQLTAFSNISGDSTRGKIIPPAPQSSARETSEYCRSATRITGRNPIRFETRQMSCTVSRSNPPCSVSTKAHWNPAAINIRATSGDRSCPNPQPSCIRPSAKACFTRFFCMKSHLTTFVPVEGNVQRQNLAGRSQGVGLVDRETAQAKDFTDADAQIHHAEPADRTFKIRTVPYPEILRNKGREVIAGPIVRPWKHHKEQTKLEANHHHQQRQRDL